MNPFSPKSSMPAETAVTPEENVATTEDALFHLKALLLVEAKAGCPLNPTKPKLVCHAAGAGGLGQSMSRRIGFCLPGKRGENA